MAIIAAHAQATRSQVTAYRPDLPDELDAVIARALGVAPDQRYATCGDLVVAADEALHPDAQRDPTAAPTEATPGRRHRT